MGAMNYLDLAKRKAGQLVGLGYTPDGVAQALNAAFPFDFVAAGSRVVARWGRDYCFRVHVI